MAPTKAWIYLPKFKIQNDLSLSNVFAAAGVKDVFSPDANFTPMGLSKPFYIHAALHRTVLDVNEAGTVGSDSMGEVMRQSQAENPPTINVNHPFFFAIRDNKTGSILFMGVVRNPK